jgi:hypothetical protein
MPVLKRKKTKRGFMYFRDGKLISKKSYDMSKARTSSRRSPRASASKKGKRKMARKSIPHPSVTGMASGLAIASYLNAGSKLDIKNPATGNFLKGDGVLKDITDGELGQAFSTLSSNAVNMIGSDAGRKTLVGASLVAMAGAFARTQCSMCNEINWI